MPRPLYAGGFEKRLFHSGNKSNVFRPHYSGEVRNAVIAVGHFEFVCGILGQRNHIAILEREADVFKFLGFEQRCIGKDTGYRTDTPSWIQNGYLMDRERTQNEYNEYRANAQRVRNGYGMNI